MHHEKQIHKDILDTSINILNSQTLKDIWSCNHRSKANHNPAINIAEHAKNISKNIEDHPQMLLFIRELIGIEINALKSKKNLELKQYIEQLYRYSNKLCKDNNITHKNTELPDEYQLILDELEYQTGKTPIRPLKSLWKITKSSANHIAQDAKEHPILFGSLVSVAVGMVYVSSINIDKLSTIYIEEDSRDIVDLGDDFWNDSEYSSSDDLLFDSELAGTINLDPSCHETTVEMGRLLAGDYGAAAVQNIPSFITDMFPEHCTRVKSLASDAINGLQGGFSWIHERLDIVIRDPANDIGNTVLHNTVFQESFINAANHTADFWYRFNDIENIAVHTLLTGVTAAAIVKYESLSTEETQEWKNNVSDFFHRTTKNLPLSYILACSGSIYAYASNNGVTPDLLWYGLGGVIAGNTIHKLHRSSKAHEIVENTILSVDRTKADIIDATKILYEDLICNDNYNYKNRGWKDYIKAPAVIAGVSSSLTAIDIATTNGQITGAIAGGTTVTAQYLMYNVVEDTALHGVFITLGIVIGKSITYAAKVGNKIKHLIGSDIS